MKFMLIVFVVLPKKNGLFRAFEGTPIYFMFFCFFGMRMLLSIVLIIVSLF